MSSIVPQIHGYHSLLCCGLLRTKFQKDTIFTRALKVFHVCQPVPRDPCKDHLSQVLPGAQTHIPQCTSHTCAKTTAMRKYVCVCRVLSTRELTGNTHKSGPSSSSVTSGLGVDLTSLSVCGEPEFALGFLILIQECQFPLHSTLESITTSSCLPTHEKNEVQLFPSSLWMSPGASPLFLKGKIRAGAGPATQFVGPHIDENVELFVQKAGKKCC